MVFWCCLTVSHFRMSQENYHISFLHASLLCGVLAVFRWCLGGIEGLFFFLTKLAHLSVPNWHQRKRETLQLEVVFFWWNMNLPTTQQKKDSACNISHKNDGF